MKDMKATFDAIADAIDAQIAKTEDKIRRLEAGEEIPVSEYQRDLAIEIELTQQYCDALAELRDSIGDDHE